MLPLLVIATLGGAAFLTVRRVSRWDRWPAVGTFLTVVGKVLYQDFKTIRSDLWHWRTRRRFRQELG